MVRLLSSAGAGVAGFVHLQKDPEFRILEKLCTGQCAKGGFQTWAPRLSQQEGCSPDRPESAFHSPLLLPNAPLTSAQGMSPNYADFQVNQLMAWSCPTNPTTYHHYALQQHATQCHSPSNKSWTSDIMLHVQPRFAINV